MRILKCLFLVFVLTSLGGCATFGLPDDATSEQKEAAMCADARTAVALADAWIPIVSDEALA
jgi:hypothetical protein